MPVVILDSTVLVAAGQFTGTSVALLRKLLGRSDFSLKIPWVVREEVINKYREQLSEKVNKAETAIKNLNKILPLINDAVPSNNLNIDWRLYVSTQIG
jgi:predicted nucleic acid-binding protein